GIGVGDLHFQTRTHTSLEGSLQRVVVAVSEREEAPIDLLILRPASERLRHSSAKCRIWSGYSTAVGIAHTVGEGGARTGAPRLKKLTGVHFAVYPAEHA